MPANRGTYRIRPVWKLRPFDAPWLAGAFQPPVLPTFTTWIQFDWQQIICSRTCLRYKATYHLHIAASCKLIIEWKSWVSDEWVHGAIPPFFNVFENRCFSDWPLKQTLLFYLFWVNNRPYKASNIVITFLEQVNYSFSKRKIFGMSNNYWEFLYLPMRRRSNHSLSHLYRAMNTRRRD